MADAPDLGSGVLDVWVRIPPRVPLRINFTIFRTDDEVTLPKFILNDKNIFTSRKLNIVLG